VSQPFEQVPPPSAGDTEEIDALPVDALPVLADEPRVLPAHQLGSAPATYWRSTSVAIPAAQAAAAAAGGFVAGAAIVRLVGRRHRRLSPLLAPRRGMRRSARRSRGGSKAGELVQIVGSRSLLVDVHLLGGRGGT
jgi:hypothetical protein